MVEPPPEKFAALPIRRIPMKSHSDRAGLLWLHHVPVLRAFQSLREPHGTRNRFQNKLDSTFRAVQLKLLLTLMRSVNLEGTLQNSALVPCLSHVVRVMLFHAVCLE